MNRPPATVTLTSNYTAVLDLVTGCGILVVREVDDVLDPFPTYVEGSIPGAVVSLSTADAEHDDAMTHLWNLGFKYAEDNAGDNIRVAPLLIGDWSAWALTPCDPEDLIGDVIGPEHLASWQALDVAAYALVVAAAA